jgi:homoserine O-acetyltransferase
VLKAGFDANDWIARTWAYDHHDIGQTPGFGGDHRKALAAIKARTLILTGGNLDLYNPVEEAREAGAFILHPAWSQCRPCRVTRQPRRPRPRTWIT